MWTARTLPFFCQGNANVQNDVLVKIKELKNKSAVIPIIKVKDSIKLIKNDMVLKNIDRENVYFSQTPQGYNLVKLEKAYNQVNKKKLSNYTDDAQKKTAWITLQVESRLDEGAGPRKGSLRSAIGRGGAEFHLDFAAESWF